MPPAFFAEMHYQPIRHLGTGRILYHEALLRVKGVDTESFLAEAAVDGYSNRVERTALSLVLRDLQGEYLKNCAVGVNISQKALTEDRSCWRYLQQMARIRPYYLELTEQHRADHQALLQKRLGRLRDLGVTLVMDDFGQGHAHLLDLIQGPFEFVKLDKKWNNLLGQTTDPTRAAQQRVLDGLLRGLQTFGLQIIREGVEQLHQMDAPFLQDTPGKHILFGQGYALGRPSRIPDQSIPTPP